MTRTDVVDLLRRMDEQAALGTPVTFFVVCDLTNHVRRMDAQAALGTPGPHPQVAREWSDIEW